MNAFDPRSLIAHQAVRRAVRVSLALLFTLGGIAIGRADYRLAVGDVLELSAVGIPELKQRAQIAENGQVSLPLAGTLPAKGLTLAELRAKLRQILPTREFRRRTEEGREYPVILAPGDVDVGIAEYRPVYVNGDVSKPGEVVYRPGLSVRQAIALAGGYDLMRLRMNNPFLEQADIKSEYSALWVEFAKEQMHIARLQAELAGRSEIDRTGVQKTPVPASVAADIERITIEQLAARNTDYAKEKDYLKEAVASEDKRILILSDQLEKEKAGVEADTEELARVKELLQRGSTVVTRVVDARRSLLLSSTRQLETAAQLATVERQRQDFSRRAEKLDDQRRMEFLSELQEARAKLAGLRARLEAAGEKLVYVGMVRSQLVRGSGSEPEIAIFRKNERGVAERIAAEQDSEVLPGDVVEVALQGDLVPRAPSR
jgi:polysaccharide export outer membrane protein